MVAGSCIVCGKSVSRTKKAISCCVCSKLTHSECGGIDDTTINAIINGTIEWKCLSCRNKSTRRSSVTTGSVSNLTSSASANQKASKSLSRQEPLGNVNSSRMKGHSSPPADQMLVELNQKISLLSNGFNVASDAIQEMREQMTSIQSITATLTDHASRITNNTDRIALLEQTIKKLNRRMDEVERNVMPQFLQVNGIPHRDNENLVDTIVNIGKVIGVHIEPASIRKAERLHNRKYSAANGNSIGHPATNTEISTQRNDTQSPSSVEMHHQPASELRPYMKSPPILVGFHNETFQRSFLAAFRRKGEIGTDSIGLCSEIARSKIFIFEHLSIELRKTYINAKLFQRNNNYKFLWTRDGKIFLRKSEDSKVIRVLPHTDLSRIEDEGEKKKRNGGSELRRGNGRGGVSR